MNGANPRDPREAALRRLVRDARDASPPDLDWSRIEERLLRQTRQAPTPAKRSPYPFAWGRVGPSPRPPRCG